MKKCTKCRKFLPVTEFNVDRAKKDGLRCYCRNCQSTYRLQWGINNRDKLNANQNRFYENNKQIVILRQQRAIKENIQRKLSVYLRNRLNMALKNKQKIGSAVADLGCTIDKLKQYLETRFQPGMSWDNWSLSGWHIDHITPLSKFKLTDREQFLEACNYTNLQPLWAADNIRKGGHFELRSNS